MQTTTQRTPEHGVSDLGAHEQRTRGNVTQRPHDPAADPALIGELTQAGEAVDRAIGKMLAAGLGPVSVASALLGGALCLMSRTMGDEAVLQLLQNAAAGVRAGDLRQ